MATAPPASNGRRRGGASSAATTDSPPIFNADGWYAPISRTWFSGSYDQPTINNTSFYWYVFAIPARRRYRADHYVFCDYLQVRE